MKSIPSMHQCLLALAALALCARAFAASPPAPSQETLEDIAKHETIAAAHSAATHKPSHRVPRDPLMAT